MLTSSSLVFLKLGGSLITDKSQAHTPRADVLRRLAAEIASARTQHPGLRLLLGHGSGSFGHVSGQKYGTRQGVRTAEQWLGFTEVWEDASDLHRLVIEALHRAGLPALSFPPSASVIARDGQVLSWDLAPLRSALAAGLLPVVYGDVVFDTARGGTILSTEDLFAHLALDFNPARVLLAGLEPGVWADFPTNTRLLAEITPQAFLQAGGALQGSAAVDVTGGMAAKVAQMLELCRQIPGLQARIFSGETPGMVEQALSGRDVGTLVRAN